MAAEPLLASIIIRLVAGGLAAFCAILAWARTRDSAWMLVILATLLRYAGTVYRILDDADLGGLAPTNPLIAGLLDAAIDAIPTLLLAAALLTVAFRVRQRVRRA